MKNYDLIVKPSKLTGEVIAPSSKSFAHRILISAFLSGEEVIVKNLGTSVDVEVTLNALKAMGATVKEIENGIIIKRGNTFCNGVTVDCVESGSSLRFLLPVASAFGINVTFTGSKRLLERPISELTKVLNQNGADIVGYTVNGKLKAGKFFIDGSISSQYVTGLLLALSVIDGESEIIINGKLVSKPYVDITLSVLKEFGVKFKQTENGYIIYGGYNLAKTEFTVEGDWSGSAFILASGAIGGKVIVSGLNLNSCQGDMKIVDILKRFGAKITCQNDNITVEKASLTAITYDMEDIPDLCQIVAVVGAYAKGETVLTGVNRLKLKESDRISAIVNSLSLAGVKVSYDGDKIVIFGGNGIKNAIIDGGNDHRTVMSAIVMLSGANGVSKVTGAQAINKSYPEFIKDFKRIGGDVDVAI